MIQVQLKRLTHYAFSTFMFMRVSSEMDKGSNYSRWCSRKNVLGPRDLAMTDLQRNFSASSQNTMDLNDMSPKIITTWFLMRTLNPMSKLTSSQIYPNRQLRQAVIIKASTMSIKIV